MATFQKFNFFIQGLGRGTFNLNADILAVYLSDTAPDQSTAQVKADVPEIATGNGYTGPVAISNAYSQTSGIGNLTSSPSVAITASGGSVGPFRYVILCDTTQAGSPLIAFADYGSEVTLLSGATFTINFASTIAQIQ